MSAKFFPIILIALQIGATAVYACKGDIRHAVYWIAAAIITVTVTF